MNKNYKDYKNYKFWAFLACFTSCVLVKENVAFLMQHWKLLRGTLSPTDTCEQPHRDPVQFRHRAAGLILLFLSFPFREAIFCEETEQSGSNCG